MSALCHNRKWQASLDHLVGTREQARWNGKPDQVESGHASMKGRHLVLEKYCAFKHCCALMD